MTNFVSMRSPSSALVPCSRVDQGPFVLPKPPTEVRVGRMTFADASHSMPALTQVSGPVANATSAVIYVAVAAGWAFFSYSLFAGKWLFTARHPVWGTITGLIALSSLLGAASSIQAENAK